MKLRNVLCVVALSTGLLACGSSPSEPTPSPSSGTFREDAARTLAHRLGTAAERNALLEALRSERRGLPLDELAIRLPAFASDVAALRARAAGALASDAVPEVWLYEPRDTAAPPEDLLVAFAPRGNERSWSEVTAYDLEGQRVTLDARTAPPVPVLVVEARGRAALRAGVRTMNAELARAGLQPSARAGNVALASTGGTWTLRLDAISLRDDQEPWISGGAEVYAVVSGVVGDNQPAIRIVDLPYLDSDGRDYYPTQIIANWSDFSYQAVNVQLFEQDDDTNYQALVAALIAAVGAAGSLAGQAEVTAIATIAGRILEAMPSSWFSNDDDYLDSFYTLEKSTTYAGRFGAAGNARATFVPYFLPLNGP